MSLSLSDLLLLYLVLHVSIKVTYTRIFLFFTCFFILATFGFFSNHYPLNGFFSLSLKIYLGIALITHYEHVRPKRLDRVILTLYILLLFSLTIFFGEKSPLTSLGLYNANESINYLLALWILLLIMDYNSVHTSKSLTKYKWPFVCIVIISIMLISRQGLIISTFYLMLVIFCDSKIKKLYRISVLLISIITVYYVLIYLNSLDEYTLRRIAVITTGEITTRSDLKRFDLVMFGINGFWQYPFGHGLQSFVRDNPSGYVAHNFYVTVLYEFGILGLLLLVWFFTKLIWVMRNSLLRNNDTLGINILIFTFCIQLIFIGALGKAGFFVVFPWIFCYSRLVQRVEMRN